MKAHLLPIALPALLCLAACGTPPRPPFPTISGTAPEPDLTLVWVGSAQAERFENGSWNRTPDYDYEFSVEQRRFPSHWESIKSVRWRQPGYDGAAGEREQTWFFRVDLSKSNDNQVRVAVRSSLGDGHGQTDAEFRQSTIEVHANVSSLAPFDTYRFTQKYAYEEGALDEIVELLKHQAKGEQVWVRNREHARLFAPQTFKSAPSRFGKSL